VQASGNKFKGINKEYTQKGNFRIKINDKV
jgi:hypothetical protein